MKNHPQPTQAEVLSVEWLMLLQLPVHLGDLQGLVVEELILLEEGQQRPEQRHKERLQGGPCDSGAT